MIHDERARPILARNDETKWVVCRTRAEQGGRDVDENPRINQVPECPANSVA